MKAFLIGILTGFLIGCLAVGSVYVKEHNQAVNYLGLWCETRDAWLQDRRDWRDGKSFEPNYGQYGQRW